MDLTIHSQVHNYVMSRLSLHGDIAAPGQDDPLFSSARLDSLDAVDLVIFLEEQFGVDFSRLDFDLTLLDTVRAMTALIDEKSEAA